MKELSIEEKAKAYDELFVKAQQIYNKENDVLILHTVEDLFPEIKESDGERIRKVLIDLVKCNERSGYTLLNNVTTDSMLAWLEKQGEQKPADKVEPKFKTGAWIVTSYGKVNQVIAVDEDGDGFTLDDDTYFSGSWEDMYHLWAIADAKNGDVLVCIGKYGQEIGIIKEYVGKYCCCDKCFETYCFVDWDGIFRTGEYMGSKEIYPATKEQRDTLMKAMADAGYTFDFEKKELKKIEDEPENYKQQVMSKMTDFFKDYIRPNPAWGEEDDNCLSTIIAEFSKCAGKSVSKDEWMRCNDFLNSLKDRVQP